MSISNTHWLLMSVVLFLIPISGMEAFAPVDTPSNPNQEIIVVSLEGFDSASADQLSSYILRLYEERVNAQITIKKYVNSESDCGELTKVIERLEEKISHEQTIHVIQGEKPSKTSHDYFSITVTGPAVIQ